MKLSNQCPPDDAGVGLAVPPTGAAEGGGLAARLGLNKLGNLSLNLRVGVGLADGLAVASGCVFLRSRLAVGDAAGDSAVTGEIAVSLGVAVASAPLGW